MHAQMSRGLGLKNFYTWNKATIAKLVWAISHKKDVQWVKWIYSWYLKDVDWWHYKPPYDSSWYWKKICTKERFKEGYLIPRLWDWQGSSTYSVKAGYKWQHRSQEKVQWDKLIWARTMLPKHSFVVWVFIHNRLPTLYRLSKFSSHANPHCALC